MYNRNLRKFTFDGQSSDKFGIMATGFRTFGAPGWDLEHTPIPGRNGDRIWNYGRLKNKVIEYPISVADGFAVQSEAIKAWLLASQGEYRELRDEYHPGFFRLASFAGPLDFDVCNFAESAETAVRFNCRPELFSDEGKKEIAVPGDGSIFNEYEFDAKPIIKVTDAPNGSTFAVNGVECKILAGNGTLVIDCEALETRDAYGNDRNSAVYIPKYPVFRPGANTIRALTGTTGYSKFRVIPRWWTV